MSHLPAGLDDPTRGIYTNRTLNLRSIKAIGYDMDYTLVHYNVDAWEGRAYEHVKRKLLARGWPVGDLTFDPKAVTRGLIVDRELGNIIKVNRFGYVKRAAHGTQVLDYRSMRNSYSRTIVSLHESRYIFLNTLFSISEACWYSQLVDLYDDGLLPEIRDYADLYATVRGAIDATHIEGELKEEIMASPEDYVDLDPEMPLALLDQKQAGKRLVLITNSGWKYTKFMMQYAFDQFLPGDMTWQDVFELGVVSSRKPSFFSGNNPMLEVDPDTGLMSTFVGDLQAGKIYFGGSATRLEKYLGCSGDQILYVGDHLFTDVNVTKSLLRWRTALIMRELEEELVAIHEDQDAQDEILDFMDEKEALEDHFSQLRLKQQRLRAVAQDHEAREQARLSEQMTATRDKLVELDNKIAPLVIRVGKSFNERWGHLMRTGNDKSHLTRQVERYADIYTSRVSNFLHYTPFMYFRAPRGSLPHDLDI